MQLFITCSFYNDFEKIITLISVLMHRRLHLLLRNLFTTTESKEMHVIDPPLEAKPVSDLNEQRFPYKNIYTLVERNEIGAEQTGGNYDNLPAIVINDAPNEVLTSTALTANSYLFLEIYTFPSGHVYVYNQEALPYFLRYKLFISDLTTSFDFYPSLCLLGC